MPWIGPCAATGKNDRYARQGNEQKSSAFARAIALSFAVFPKGMLATHVYSKGMFMRTIFCMTALAATLPAAPTLAEEGAELKTAKDKLSHALGMDVATTLRRQSIEIGPAVFVQGLNDAYAGHKLFLSHEEARGVLADMQKQMRKKMEEARTQVAEQESRRNISCGEQESARRSHAAERAAI
jgi:hypothetical protein